MVAFEKVHEWMSQANLLIFVVVLSMLILASIYLQRKRKFVWHGNTMLVTVMVALLLTIVHMAPSFIAVIQETLRELNLVALLGIVHGTIGIATLSYGAWLVGVWAFSQSSETKFCASKKKLMWKIFVLWILALGFGVFYYPLHLIWG